MTTTSGVINESGLEDLVLGYFKAYSSHEVAAVVAFYTDEIEIYDGAFDSSSAGKQEVQQEVVETFLGLVPDLNWQHRAGTPIVVDGNTVAIEWEFSGSPAAGLEGIPDELRKPFRCKGMSRFTIDSERQLIVSHADYYNPPAFFAFL